MDDTSLPNQELNISMDEFVEILKLNKKYPQCVHSGYCCKKSPCAFGEMNKEWTRCIYLNPENKCDRHDWILQQPLSKWNPAFGAGCCSPMNSDRMEILKQMEKGD